LARKILLADDSVTAQNMGRRILSDAGYEVVTVNNGSAALKKIAESKPDLIVLDVYMPGYGGLEVCQRLRESKETARIPILLTVGKLEPFKPEEARRVKADAFIVKPFEASELLTALTKLEERIVPQPAPYKPGRFAKAISALETDPASNDYGDLESGWKNRLKIPVPQSHGPDVEVEEQVETELRKPGTRAEQKPVELPAALPRDITPEEIAAIHAAAAAFGTQIAEPVTDEQPAASIAPSESVSETAAGAPEVKSETIADAGDLIGATFASAASVEETHSEPERAEQEQKIEPAVAEAAVNAEVAGMAASTAIETQSELPVAAEEVAGSAPVEAPPITEERDDFAAALESLGPSNRHSVPQFNGPRWVAESIAVADTESAAILEEEMQKALAAMAAVQADEQEQSSAAVESVAVASAEHERQEAAEAVAESVVSPSREHQDAATSLVAAMMNETTAPTRSDLVEAVLPRDSEPAAPESRGAAFAAAAAGNAEAVSQLAVPSEVQQSTASPNGVDDRQRESELAAAWESWKQIRESVVDPQLKSQVSETSAEMHAPQVEPPSDPQPGADSETGDQEESVASIVDSVLADLKPKLMEEISRKMGKEKKRR
jgi:CheY-like chemotaxis protein